MNEEKRILCSKHFPEQEFSGSQEFGKREAKILKEVEFIVQAEFVE